MGFVSGVVDRDSTLVEVEQLASLFLTSACIDFVFNYLTRLTETTLDYKWQSRDLPSN